MTTDKEAPEAQVAPEGDTSGGAGAEPSSHTTCGQFPADEVAATHEGVIPADPKSE